MSQRLLLLTNGHGEDALGLLLLRELEKAYPKLRIDAFPLVGEGDAFNRQGIPIHGVQKTMPSGGFVWEGSTNLVRDLFAGLLGLVGRQWRWVAQKAPEYNGIIALGDVFPLVLGAYAGRRPLVFVPTAKSQYIQGHYGWEKGMMRKFALKVFPRDEATAIDLQKAGVPAVFVGNLMMDALEFTATTFGLEGRRPVIAFLPGSRADAYVNCEDLLRVAENFEKSTTILLSVVPSLDVDPIRKLALAQGWKVDTSDAGGHEGSLRLVKNNATVFCITGYFGDILNRADIVVGLAGTGNEQAVGMGKPVVTFPGRGMQFTRKFALAQRRLLGEAVSLMNRDHRSVALEVQHILDDPARYQHMAKVGKERMGSPGAGARMAKEIGTVFEL